MALVTVYDKDGKSVTRDSVDAREYVETGNWFYIDPTAKKAVAPEDDKLAPEGDSGKPAGDQYTDMTREALQTVLQASGIKFDGRVSDDKLRELCRGLK